MPNTAELVKLPVAERIALIDELWASIWEEDLPIEPAQVNEARARWQELKANPSLGLAGARWGVEFVSCAIRGVVLQVHP